MLASRVTLIMQLQVGAKLSPESLSEAGEKLGWMSCGRSLTCLGGRLQYLVVTRATEEI